MARKRKRRLTPEAKRKRLLNDALKALQIGRAQFSDEQLRAEAEHHRFARESRADNQLAEGIGDRHFGSKHQLLWWRVRRALNGCRKISQRETIEELAAMGQGKHPRKHRYTSRGRPVEKLLHEALLRQHARNFDKFCKHLAWLCEELLPRVLHNPNRAFINKRDDDFCWRIQILHTGLPLPKDKLDFVRIARAILKNAELRAGLLALYFLYPEKRRATRSNKINPRRERRPLFRALDDICNHWQQRQENPYTSLLDVLAWNFDDFKSLKGSERVRAIFMRAGLDLAKWCIEHGRDEADVVRHLDRAMTDQLRLREKRHRSQ
jgi:hypothetical protein